MPDSDANVSDNCRSVVEEVSDRQYFSVTQFARALGYSRDRFYELRRLGVFPRPATQVNGRPVYDRGQLVGCCWVIKHGVGMNGKPIMLRNKPPRQTTEYWQNQLKRVSSLKRKLQHLGVTCTVRQLESCLYTLPIGAREANEATLIPALVKAMCDASLLDAAGSQSSVLAAQYSGKQS